MSSTPSFEDYVTVRWPRLVRAVVLLGADVQTAEDTVQNGLAKCYLRWERILATRDVDAYVHRVVFNAYVDDRRRFWHRERPSDVPAAAGVAPRDDLDERLVLRTALRRLPSHQREVVVLRFFADLTEQQTADVLDIAIGTVKSRTSRALATLSADPSLIEATGGDHS